jgi:hypothetical protein
MRAPYNAREPEDPESPKTHRLYHLAINRSFVFLRARAIWETRALLHLRDVSHDEQTKDTPTIKQTSIKITEF